MEITKVLPDFYMTDLDCNKVKLYLTEVLQTVMNIPAYRSNVTTRSVGNDIEFQYYLPMIDNNINGMLNNEGSIIVDMLDNNIIVATLKSGSRSYVITDSKFIDARENGDTFIKFNEDLFLVTSYGSFIYSQEFGRKVVAIVDSDNVPYNSLEDAFVMVKLSGTTEYYEGLDGIKYFNYLFKNTDLPEYLRMTNSWLGELFK